jgi:hypothetical protein
MSATSPLPTERAEWIGPLAKLELWLGSIVAGLGAVLLVMWRTGRDTDRHGMVFVFLGAVFILPLGLALVVAGLGLRHGGRRLRLLQLMPITWVVAYFLLLKWALFR